MSLNLEAKKTVVADVGAVLEKAQTMVISEYRGINVAEINNLRAQARTSDVYLRVLKNTLVRRAVEGTSFSSIGDQLVGPLIYSMSEDPIAAARVVHDFAKTNSTIVIKGGCHSGKVLDADGVKALASIPGREILLAKLLGVMQAPITGFACALAALTKQREAQKA